MTESDTDPLTLPAQLKTKTIPCWPKCSLKHYIRPSRLIYVSYSASINRQPWMIYYSTRPSIVSAAPSTNMVPNFNDPKNKSFENTVGRGEMLVTSIFSFSHSDFYSIKERNRALTHSHTMTPFDDPWKQSF